MIKFLFLFLLLPLEGFTQVSPPPVAEPPLSYRNIYKQEKNGIWGMTGQLGAQEETLIPFEYEYLCATKFVTLDAGFQPTQSQQGFGFISTLAKHTSNLDVQLVFASV